MGEGEFWECDIDANILINYFLLNYYNYGIIIIFFLHIINT